MLSETAQQEAKRVQRKIINQLSVRYGEKLDSEACLSLARLFLSLFQRQSLRYPIDNSGRPWSWYLWIVKIAKVKCWELFHPALEQEGLSPFPKSLPALFSVTLNVERGLLHQLSFELGKSEIPNATWKAKKQKSHLQCHHCRASTFHVRPSQLPTCVVYRLDKGTVTCWKGWHPYHTNARLQQRGLQTSLCCKF